MQFKWKRLRCICVCVCVCARQAPKAIYYNCAKISANGFCIARQKPTHVRRQSLHSDRSTKATAVKSIERDNNGWMKSKNIWINTKPHRRKQLQIKYSSRGCEHMTDNDVDVAMHTRRQCTIFHRQININSWLIYIFCERNHSAHWMPFTPFSTPSSSSFETIIIMKIVIMWNKRKIAQISPDAMCRCSLARCCCRRRACDTIYDVKYIAFAFFTVHNHK